jgi:uncharacterized membrane protein
MEKPAAKKFSVNDLTLAGIIAALYVLLTLPFAQISFGILQFRLAEALTVLPILNAAAIPGVFVGCLLANLLNPQSLGIVDILGGSLATLLAAYLSYKLGAPWQTDQSAGETSRLKLSWRHIPALLPPIIVNAFTVGVYLPCLLLDEITLPLVLGSVGSIALTQTLVIFALGLPLLITLRRTGQLRK